VDRALRPVWQYVHQGAGGGRCGRAADEECGLGGSGECFALVDLCGGHVAVLGSTSE